MVRAIITPHTAQPRAQGASRLAKQIAGRPGVLALAQNCDIGIAATPCSRVIPSEVGVRPRRDRRVSSIWKNVPRLSRLKREPCTSDLNYCGGSDRRRDVAAHGISAHTSS